MIQRTFGQLYEMLRAAGQLQVDASSNTMHVSAVDTEAPLLTGVSTDSRSIVTGQLFIPLIGERYNGHTYIQQAFAQGAGAALWQADQPDPPVGKPLIVVRDTLRALQQLAAAYRRSLSLKVVAVTGSNGKTTTKDIIAALLATSLRVQKTKGNLNNHIGLPLTILECAEQTQLLVAEMGMSGSGEISLLSQIAAPDIAVITMIGESHIEQLGSRAAIARAKFEIVEGLSPDGILYYHGEEPLLREHLAHHQRPLHAISIGSTAASDFYATNVELDSAGASFTVNQRPQPVYQLPLLGAHNVHNALIGLAIAEQFGITETQRMEALAQLQITAMRGQKLTTANGVTLINDAYNASPSSMRAALDYVRNLQGYRHKIVVLADMLELGEFAQSYHEQIGDQLALMELAYVFTFGELAQMIAERARRGLPAERVRSGLSKQQICAELTAVSSAGDLILFKGSRGMKLEEIVTQLTQ